MRRKRTTSTSLKNRAARIFASPRSAIDAAHGRFDGGMSRANMRRILGLNQSKSEKLAEIAAMKRMVISAIPLAVLRTCVGLGGFGPIWHFSCEFRMCGRSFSITCFRSWPPTCFLWSASRTSSVFLPLPPSGDQYGHSHRYGHARGVFCTTWLLFHLKTLKPIHQYR